MGKLNKDSWWWRKGRVLVIAALVLALTGSFTRLWDGAAWDAVRERQPELNLASVEDALGQGMIIGLLGGFRTLIADMLFINANVHWQNKDRPKTETLLRMVTAVDPRPMFFWLNGARMIGYDMPVWRVQELGGFDEVPKALKDQIWADYAHRAMHFIEGAKEFHPEDYRVPLEIAQIYNNRLEDKEKAAEWYLETTRYPDAPFFVARIHAELLRQAGREREAYNYLRNLYSTLPDDNPMATKPVVLGRIRDLEESLDLPAFQRLPLQAEERWYHSTDIRMDRSVNEDAYNVRIGEPAQ